MGLLFLVLLIANCALCGFLVAKVRDITRWRDEIQSEHEKLRWEFDSCRMHPFMDAEPVKVVTPDA